MDNQHPNRDQLTGYSLGLLPEKEAQALAQHLKDCAQCEATIQAMAQSSDTLAKGTAAASAAAPKDAASKSSTKIGSAGAAPQISIEQFMQAVAEIGLLTADEVQTFRASLPAG